MPLDHPRPRARLKAVASSEPGAGGLGGEQERGAGPEAEAGTRPQHPQVRVQVVQVVVPGPQEGRDMASLWQAVQGLEQGKAGHLQAAQPPLQAQIQGLPLAPEVCQAQVENCSQG